MKEQANIKKDKVPYAQVANELLYDKNISMKAKGLFAYLVAKPDQWDFSAKRIAEENKDCRDSILSGMKELENVGYIQRTRKPSGRIEYLLHNLALKATNGKSVSGLEKPQTEIPTVANPHRGESPPVRKKDSKKERVKERKTSKTSFADKKPKHNPLGEQIIHALLEVNPACRKHYANKTQRSACDRLLEDRALEQILAVIALLPKTNKKQYFPFIDTPLKLEDKWFQLASALQKEKNNTPLIL